MSANLTPVHKAIYFKFWLKWLLHFALQLDSEYTANPLRSLKGRKHAFLLQVRGFRTSIGLLRHHIKLAAVYDGTRSGCMGKSRCATAGPASTYQGPWLAKMLDAAAYRASNANQLPRTRSGKLHGSEQTLAPLISMSAVTRPRIWNAARAMCRINILALTWLSSQINQSQKAPC